MNDKCPQCGSEKADCVSDVFDNGENTVYIVVCQCPDCGEETVTYPEFPEYTGF